MILISLNLQADENFVTVYNEDLALVKQIRTVSIKMNELPLKFTDVAARLIPTSVHLRSLSGNTKFRVLEQNFEFDLVSSDKILEKYIDHPELPLHSLQLSSGRNVRVGMHPRIHHLDQG